MVVLGQLAQILLPFRVPTPLGAFPEAGRPTIIRQWHEGLPADLRNGRIPNSCPADLVGQVAAAIHAVDMTNWSRRPYGCRTQREHGEEMLHALDGLAGTEAECAREWATHHLPPRRPSVLLHGDLLGQNILVSPEQPPAVIDWEFCRLGDPAYDLGDRHSRRTPAVPDGTRTGTPAGCLFCCREPSHFARPDPLLRTVPGGPVVCGSAVRCRIRASGTSVGPSASHPASRRGLPVN